MKSAIVGAFLVPVSSFFGVQAWTFGFLWIWQPSVVADLVFIVGTVAAHVGAVWVGSHVHARPPAWIAAFATGWLAHWLVYAMSWNLFLAAAEGEDFNMLGSMGFVAQMGYIGLIVVALAAVASLEFTRPRAPSR